MGEKPNRGENAKNIQMVKNMAEQAKALEDSQASTNPEITPPQLPPKPDGSPIPPEIFAGGLKGVKAPAEELVGQGKLENVIKPNESFIESEKKYFQTKAYFERLIEATNDKLEELSFNLKEGKGAKEDTKNEIADVKKDYKKVSDLLHDLENGKTEQVKVFIADRLELAKKQIEIGEIKEDDDKYTHLLELAEELGIQKEAEKENKPQVTEKLIQPNGNIEDDSTKKVLDAAKEKLEKQRQILESAYGSGDNTIDVGAEAKLIVSQFETPLLEEIPVPKTEVEPLVTESSLEEEKEQGEAVVSPDGKFIYINGEKEKPAVEEKVRVESEEDREKREKAEAQLAEEMRLQKIKEAKEELIKTAEQIKTAVAEKNKSSEALLLESAKGPFETATGENLERKSGERAELVAKETMNCKRVTVAEYLQENTKKETGIAEQKQRFKALKKYWANLSKEEQIQYVHDGKVDANKVAVDLDKKINDKKAELGKKGIELSTNAFYAMIDNGLRPEEIKIYKPWYSSVFKIEIPRLSKRDKSGPAKYSEKDFAEEIKEIEGVFNKSIRSDARAQLERKIISGKNIWKQIKQKCMRNIIEETADEYKKQQENLQEEQAENATNNVAPEVKVRRRKNRFTAPKAEGRHKIIKKKSKK
ncbi:MAG: hypothetical protein AAB352_00680 [Patescibacteria group bacterium]